MSSTSVAGNETAIEQMLPSTRGRVCENMNVLCEPLLEGVDTIRRP